MFGPPASGKSIFAVQLGDALSRGNGLLGFRHPRGRRRVLYVDLKHTDEQFQMRCTHDVFPRRHRFPRNLYRDRPPADTDLYEWLRSYVAANKVRTVIIDDLSAVRKTNDGTRETLRLMRRLRELRDELGVSILVITDSAPPKRGTVVSETDLGRSRVLCSVADSVFAIGRGLKHVGDHYFLQVRARNARIFWTVKNAPMSFVYRTDAGLLAFEFDERFSGCIDEKKRRLICEIVRLTEVEHKTFREIAAKLGISRSWACTLYQRWTPAMDEALSEPPVSADGQFWSPSGPSAAPLTPEPRSEQPSQYRDADDDDEDFEGYDPELRQILIETAEPHETVAAATRNPPFDPRRIPFAAALTRRWIRDLERDLDGYGREIFIESRQFDGKPAVWYSKRNACGDYTRHQRDATGVKLKNIGPSGQIPH